MKKILNTLKEKWAEYLIEIFVIIFSILIAFTLDSWNTRKSRSALFKSQLDQIYVQSKALRDRLKGYINNEEKEIAMIDQLLTAPEEFQQEVLPVLFFRLGTFSYKGFSSATSLILTSDDLNVLDKNIQTQDLIFEILKAQESLLNWSNDLEQNFGLDRSFINTVISWGIPRITQAEYSFDGKEVNYSDPNFYSEQHFEILRDKVSKREGQDLLRSQRSLKKTLLIDYNFIIGDLELLMQRIELYYPNVGLKVESIGIIGTALPYAWEKSVPMKYNKSRNVWIIDLSLKAGEVKFRANDNWLINWGGSNFPKGEAIQNGPNIPVDEGRYRIEIDIKNGEYRFEKVGE